MGFSTPTKEGVRQAEARIHLKFLNEFCVYPKRMKEHRICDRPPRWGGVEQGGALRLLFELSRVPIGTCVALDNKIQK